MLKSILRSKSLWSGIVFGAALGMTSAPASAQMSVTYAGWGGESQEAIVKALLAPAKSLGIDVREDRHGGFPGLRTHVTAGNVKWSLASMGVSRCEQAAQAGLLEKLDYSVIDASRLNKAWVNPYYIGAFTFSYGVGYNKKKFASDPPKNWADFWNVKKYPGRRAMFNAGVYVFEAALMADGVKPADVYKVLKTKEGIDRAFKKLEELKPHVAVWWTSSGQAMQLIRDGEVDLIMIANGRAGALIADGAAVGFSFDQAIMEYECLMIPKGAPAKDAAMKLINAALDPEPQAKFAMMIEYGPVNLKAYDAKIITPQRAAMLPTAPGNVDKQLFIDAAFYVSPEGLAAIERFTRMIQQK